MGVKCDCVPRLSVVIEGVEQCVMCLYDAKNRAETQLRALLQKNREIVDQMANICGISSGVNNAPTNIPKHEYNSLTYELKHEFSVLKHEYIAPTHEPKHELKHEYVYLPSREPQSENFIRLTNGRDHSIPIESVNNKPLLIVKLCALLPNIEKKNSEKALDKIIPDILPNELHELVEILLSLTPFISVDDFPKIPQICKLFGISSRFISGVIALMPAGKCIPTTGQLPLKLEEVGLGPDIKIGINIADFEKNNREIREKISSGDNFQEWIQYSLIHDEIMSLLKPNNRNCYC